MITKHCIVVAEDDPDEVLLLRWALKQAGFDHEFIDLNDGEVTNEYLTAFDFRFRSFSSWILKCRRGMASRFLPGWRRARI